jgi:glycerophosphoryl diester phosphodiesterase
MSRNLEVGKRAAGMALSHPNLQLPKSRFDHTVLALLSTAIRSRIAAMKTCSHRLVKLFSLSFSIAFLAFPMFAVEIIAHRGASWDAPENTLAAMKLAWEQGADCIELDLHLSGDGRLAVIHDRDTKRIGGVDRKVADQTFAGLRRLDSYTVNDARIAQRWKDAGVDGITTDRPAWLREQLQ